MASSSSSAQAAFGLGRRKKSPGLMDQIGNFFGGEKKRKSKVRKRRLVGATARPSSQNRSLTSDCCDAPVIVELRRFDCYFHGEPKSRVP